MKVRCAKCRCAVGDGATLCHRCGRDLAAHLQAVPGLIADLIVMRSRQDRLNPMTPRVHSTTTPQIPVQLAQSRGGSAPAMRVRGDRELQALTTAVFATATRLADALGEPGPPTDRPGLAQLVLNNRHHHTRPRDLPGPVRHYDSDGRLVAVRQPRRYTDALEPPATPVEQAAIWCACHAAELRTDPAAGDTYRDMSRAVLAVHGVIDPQRRRYLGPCPTETGGRADDGTARTCGYKLTAAPDRRTLRCARCHHRYVVADLEAGALRRAEDGLWTLAELLEHVLPSIGHHIPRSTLYRWAHRRVIAPRGYQSDDGRRITDRRIRATDPEVYRLGDVLAAAHRAANRTPDLTITPSRKAGT